MATLIGFGSHGSDIMAIWNRNYVEPLHAYDEAVADLPVINDVVYYGVNDPQIRASLGARLNLMAGSPLIDRSATVGHDCHIAGGCVIAPHAILLSLVTLHEHVHVNYTATMTRCTVGAYSTIAPAATICGDVTIGRECLIGANATICDRVTIGDYCRIGAGAIVPPLSVVPAGTTVVGVWKG